MAELVAGAVLGVAFQALFEVVKGTVKKGDQLKRKLRKIAAKLEALEPLVQEATRLNIELDLSRHNAAIVHHMERGSKLVSEMRLGGTRWWRFHGDSRKLAELDAALGDLMDVLQAQGVVASMRTNAAVNVLLKGRLASGLAVAVAAAAVGGGRCDPTEPPAFDVGLEMPLRELKGLVLGDAEGALAAVVAAPPGCGKTTLVLKLCKDHRLHERFMGNILFVKVSRTPNLSVVAEQIYEHYGRRVPNFRDEEDACNFLERLLREIGECSPILLVLDDVWSQSESIIDRLSFQIPRYKILVTSRFEFQRFKPVYKLKMLSDDNAMALFRHHAELDTSNIQESLVTEVVKHCKRCPLALKLIGSALRGEHPRTWRRELDKWYKGDSSILDFEKDLLLCLKSSVEVLGEKDDVLKECFVDLGSFPEDRRIPAAALIDIWTELYGIDEKVAADHLFNLNKMNMATVVVTRRDVDEDDDYYSEHFLSQHDMLRELSLHYSNQNSGKIKRLNMELPGNNSTNLANADARLLSISTDGMLSSEWRNVQLTETEVLILNFLKKDQALPELVQRMNQLKVLIVTNYGFYPAELRDFQSISYLTNLKKMRLERVEIPSLASIKLDDLQKLSLFMCKIGKAFSSIDLSEAFPNLEEMNIDYCGDLVKLPDQLCDMVKMKKLSVTHCHKLNSLPEGIGRMSNVEVLRFRSCIDLTELPASICELRKIKLLDISDCFSIRNLPEDIGKLCSLTTLNMNGCSRLQDLPPSVLDFEKLEKVVCDEEIKELWELYLPTHSEIELILAKEDINLNFL